MTEKVSQLRIIHHVDDRVIRRGHDSLAEHNLAPAVLAKDIGNILKDITGLSKQINFLLEGFRYGHARNVLPEPTVASFTSAFGAATFFGAAAVFTDFFEPAAAIDSI